MRLICDSETCLFLSAASRRTPQPSAPPAEPSGPNSSESVQYKYTEYSQFYVATARAADSIRVVVNLYFEVFSSGRYWCSYFISLSLVFPTHAVTCVSRWNPTAFLTLKHLHLKSSVSNITVCLQPSAPPDPAQKITSSSSSSSSSVSSESSQSSEVRGDLSYNTISLYTLSLFAALRLESGKIFNLVKTERSLVLQSKYLLYLVKWSQHKMVHYSKTSAASIRNNFIICPPSAVITSWHVLSFFLFVVFYLVDEMRTCSVKMSVTVPCDQSAVVIKDRVTESVRLVDVYRVHKWCENSRTWRTR